jgi:hypothetical protein
MKEANSNKVVERQNEIATLARWLWQNAGSPPGRYKEFWRKAANSKASALADIQDDSAAEHSGTPGAANGAHSGSE